MLCSCICTCSCSCHEKRQFNETIVFTIVIWSLLRATAASIFATSQLQKVLRDRQFLTLLTSKSSSRRNGVHFLTTSKSPPNLRCLGPNPLCFYQFGFEMCFAPQCRTLSQQLTFQKCSEPEVLVTFWLRNVLRAAAAGNFSTSQLPKVLREWNVFLAFWLPNLLRATMTCNFWSLLPKWLRTRPFSEPTFRSEKTRCFAAFLPFAHLDLVSIDPFSSDFSSHSFSFLPLPTSAASSVHIVGSLTSKLPSITIFFINRGCSFLVYKNDPETQLGGTTSWPEGMVPLNFSGWLGWLVEDQSSLTTLGLPMIINRLVNSG